MTEAAHEKPPAPILTRVMQLLGLAGLVFGGLILFDARDCQELDCLAGPIGVVVIVWGAVALLSGLRGPAGFVFLILALVLSVLVSWATPLIGLIALVVAMLLMSASKDRLAPYYRRQRKGAAV
jgi:hypothetical protein